MAICLILPLMSFAQEASIKNNSIANTKPIIELMGVRHNGEENYIQYQKEITKAENLMFDSLFDESIKQYRKTFDAYSFNFPRDCMIAAQLAAYIGDDTNLYYFIKKGVRFGVNINYINHRKIYSQYKSKEWWNNFVNNEYDSLRNEYLKGVNGEYKSICDKYKNIDREFRDKDQTWYNNLYIPWRFCLRKKWNNNGMEFISIVNSLIPKLGFPSYKTIGVEDSVTSTTSRYVFISSSQFNIIFNHISDKYYKTKEMQSLLAKLYDEIVKGNLSARDYARIMEINYRASNKYKRNTSLYYIWYDISFDPNVTVSNEEEINKRRDALGLSTCYYERQRKIWETHYWEFFYFKL